METYGEVVRFCFGPGAELAVEVRLGGEKGGKERLY